MYYFSLAVYFIAGDEAKQNWLKLRASFRDSRRRQLKCMKSGAAREDIKPWRLQKQMEFLEPFMSTGPRDTNIPEDAMSVNETTEETSNLENRSSTDKSNEGDIHTIEESSVTENNDCESRRRRELASTSYTSSTPVARKRQTDICNLFKQSVQERTARARQRDEERKIFMEQNSTRNDPLYNFFLSMYQATKNMPCNYQHAIKSKLFQAVSEAEAAIWNLEGSSPTLSSTSFSPVPLSLHSQSIQSPPAASPTLQPEQTVQETENELITFINNFE